MIYHSCKSQMSVPLTVSEKNSRVSILKRGREASNTVILPVDEVQSKFKFVIMIFDCVLFNSSFSCSFLQFYKDTLESAAEESSENGTEIKESDGQCKSYNLFPFYFTLFVIALSSMAQSEVHSYVGETTSGIALCSYHVRIFPKVRYTLFGRFSRL